MGSIAGVANAPCSWGVLEFSLNGDRPGYEQVLDEMAEAGYAGTALGDYGFLPTEPEALQTALAARDLVLLEAFVPVALADPEALFTGADAALQAARLLAETGNETAHIVLSDDNGTHPVRTTCAGRIEPGQGWAPKQWETAAHTADHIALKVYEETGLRTVFHPHCAGYVETPEEVGILMSVTHPRMLGLCLDTAHYAYGGGDPLELIRHYADRIWHVHFKGYQSAIAEEARLNALDYFDAVRRGVFCELETSSLDFSEILAELNAVDYAGWIVVEQDVLPEMGTPLESAKKNREYLKTLGI